ncbi:MAG: ligase-associated DNA damage response endonuclease PdeM [Sphingobacteriales bacterium]|nr:MAG: ligase-associated DNA damage response endonuclease PdeM [Sphingobacteriales bacterium]
MQLEFKGQVLTLLPERAVYKQDERLLIIADVHLGKASHFRKHGISMPASSQYGDYEKLKELIEKVHPHKVYFLGDLFHSSYNNDWHAFASLIECCEDIEFTLIKGNHDIIDYKHFDGLKIHVVDRYIEDEFFIYSHEPLKKVPEGKLNMAGHIHPGISLHGLGKQSVKLPIFHLQNGNQMTLPAFGVLTGLYMMRKNEHTQVFMVLPSEVRELKK